MSADENEEPFSPAVSEYTYIPTENSSRFSSPVRSFNTSASSALVRDVTIAITADCVTPSSRPQNLFQFSTPEFSRQIDFIASPSIVYKHNIENEKTNNSPDREFDGIYSLLVDNCDDTIRYETNAEAILIENTHEIHNVNDDNIKVYMDLSVPSNQLSVATTDIEDIQNIYQQSFSQPGTSSDPGNTFPNLNTSNLLTDDTTTNTCSTTTTVIGTSQSVERETNSCHAVLTSESKSKPRKRERNLDNWAKPKNKKLKNNGLEYVSVNNKKVQPRKELGSACNCKMQCSTQFTEDIRSELFQYYWAIGNHEKQWLFILKYLEVEEPKVIKVQRKRDRSRTLLYYLPLKRDSVVTKVRVCKVMFINTLGISEKSVYSAMNKFTNNLQITDLRGKHASRPLKTSDETEQGVIQHIKSFPCIESHYLRKQTSRQYLASDLSLAKMHRLYLCWASENLHGVKTASLYQYSNIFNSKFNLSFFKPKKDLCQICSIYENADNNHKKDLQENYENHLKNKSLVRKIKNDEKSSSDPKTKTVAVFDLEKVLNLPQSNVGIFHYKRKYPVYNFTIYNLLSLQGYCYLWHAQIAKRGANEISSCLFDFFKKEADRGIKFISLYSDNCSGQNRNRFVFAMYIYVSRTLNLDITHRFLQTGHTQNEGDSMHACVEKNLKNKIVYTPDQLYEIIMNAKVNKKFVTTEMSQNSFYDFKLMANSSKNWLTNSRGEKVYYSKMKEVRTTPEASGKLLYKYDLEQNDYFVLDTTYCSSKTRKSKLNRTGSELKAAYDCLLPVSNALFKDLNSLCDLNAIPLHYQNFYRNLVPENDARNLLPSDNSDED